MLKYFKNLIIVNNKSLQDSMAIVAIRMRYLRTNQYEREDVT